MAPPVMQRHHMAGLPNQPNPGMVGNVGNVGGVGNVGQMGPGGNNVMGNNLLPMDQWGANRYPNNASQGMRQPNQNQVMQQNAMQQQVRLYFLINKNFPSYLYDFFQLNYNYRI